MEEATHLIELKNVEKLYQMGDVTIHALRQISLTIEQGEFIAIMGQSGSGKSTTMNILGCLDRPTYGHYYLEGLDVSKFSKDELADIRNAKIGFVFQNFNLLSRTSAWENVELPMIYMGLKGLERKKIAKEALELVGLGSRLLNMPNQLSGGQQQRVAIARSLVNNPRIILADEPTGNLDSRTSLEIIDVFQTLNEKSSITIAIVTHEPDIARFAKRIIVFRDGRIIKDEMNTDRVMAKEILAQLPTEDKH